MSVKKRSRIFSQRAYDRFDKANRVEVLTFLRNRGHNIIEDGMGVETFDHDIITEKGGDRYYFEMEAKTGRPFTDRASFPFPTVSFLSRKKRLHDKHPFHYLIVCTETKCIIHCDSTTIFQDRHKEKATMSVLSDRQGTDTFYRVPKGLCNFFYANQN